MLGTLVLVVGVAGIYTLGGSIKEVVDEHRFKKTYRSAMALHADTDCDGIVTSVEKDAFYVSLLKDKNATLVPRERFYANGQRVSDNTLTYANGQRVSDNTLTSWIEEYASTHTPVCSEKR